MKRINSSIKKLSIVASTALMLSICLYAYTFVAAPDKIGVSNQNQGDATLDSSTLNDSPSDQPLADINQTLEDTPPAPEVAKPHTSNDQVLGANQTTKFADGTYLIGIDITAGTYETTDPTPMCHYEKLSGTRTTNGKLNIRSNGKPETSAKVSIDASDTAFMSTGCGTWNKIN